MKGERYKEYLELCGVRRYLLFLDDVVAGPSKSCSAEPRRLCSFSPRDARVKIDVEVSMT